MHAKMSDRERRAGDFDSISRDSILGRGEWQPEDLWAREAEREARAILAETEPEGCGSYQRLTWLGDWSADVADAMRAFLDDDTRPFVVEATAPRCMTGRPLRIQRRA